MPPKSSQKDDDANGAADASSASGPGAFAKALAAQRVTWSGDPEGYDSFRTLATAVWKVAPGPGNGTEFALGVLSALKTEGRHDQQVTHAREEVVRLIGSAAPPTTDAVWAALRTACGYDVICSIDARQRQLAALRRPPGGQVIYCLQEWARLFQSACPGLPVTAAAVGHLVHVLNLPELERGFAHAQLMAHVTAKPDIKPAELVATVGVNIAQVAAAGIETLDKAKRLTGATKGPGGRRTSAGLRKEEPRKSGKSTRKQGNGPSDQCIRHPDADHDNASCRLQQREKDNKEPAAGDSRPKALN